MHTKEKIPKLNSSKIDYSTILESQNIDPIVRSTGFRVIAIQALIFILTYFSYACLHFVREGWSILKPDIVGQESPGLNWEGTNYAGLIDFFFLFAYSFGLFISGVLGDNFPIRIILPIGYLIVAAMTIMISMGGTWRIRSIFYYIVFFSISGLCQSIGWPSFVAIMGNWISKDSRGLVFGIWTTCQSMGNIGGNVLVNILREQCNMSWMWSLRTLGIIVGVVAILNFCFLIDHPSKLDIIIEVPEDEGASPGRPQARKSLNTSKRRKSSSDIEERLLDDNQRSTSLLSDREAGIHQAEEEQTAISFWKAWFLPGVIPFVLCIACVKCATYGILLWLPSYAKDELQYNNTSVEFIAISNDIGTMFGSIILGKITDLTYKKRSPVAFFGLILGSVLFLLVVFLHDSPIYVLYTIIFFVGFFVGGIYNIVAATAAADLAKGDSLKGNDKALGTVSGILDGSGSLGAAFGSLIIGTIQTKSWDGAFLFLAAVVLISSIPIFRVFLKEFRELLDIRRGVVIEHD